MNKEPVTLINAAIAVVEAVILMAVSFGLDWTPEQIGTVMGAVVVVGALVQTVFARSKVTPLESPKDRMGRRLVPTLETDSEEGG